MNINVATIFGDQNLLSMRIQWVNQSYQIGWLLADYFPNFARLFVRHNRILIEERKMQGLEKWLVLRTLCSSKKIEELGLDPAYVIF